MKADKRLIEKRMGASGRDLATDEDSREEIVIMIYLNLNTFMKLSTKINVS